MRGVSWVKAVSVYIFCQYKLFRERVSFDVATASVVLARTAMKGSGAQQPRQQQCRRQQGVWSGEQLLPDAVRKMRYLLDGVVRLTGTRQRSPW